MKLRLLSLYWGLQRELPKIYAFTFSVLKLTNLHSILYVKLRFLKKSFPDKEMGVLFFG
jgi:hypothetical protein